jgi:hypothetical protein
MSDFPEWMGDHYREMAIKLRDLARQTLFPSVRKGLTGIAKRCDQMAERADSPHSPRTVEFTLGALLIPQLNAGSYSPSLTLNGRAAPAQHQKVDEPP